MDLGISGKVALVTASSSGLGKAVAAELFREGVKVAICSRNQDKLEKTAREIGMDDPQRLYYQTCDVTDPKQVKSMIDNLVKKWGSVDILISNAGGPPAGMIDDFKTDDYRKAVELNLLSTIDLCYQVYPYMKKQNWGRIINMTSVSVKQPIDNLILSNTSRTGVIGFTKSMSNQLARFGITVNSVCPGYTRTERVDNLARNYQSSGKGTAEDFYRGIIKNIPAGRLAEPQEFAAVVTFLASAQAAYITGVALQIDGGFTQGLY